MAIIDLDSHLRDGWLLDEIYQLPEPFAKFSPKRIGDGKYFYSKFEHDLSPMEDPVANANFKKPVTHQVFYNPEANQRGNEVMRWQQGGYDMEYRLKDNAREDIDFQLIFPTSIDIPSQNPGALGAAVARSYNDWAHKLVAGYRDRLSPVAMMPAGCPEEMPNELRHAVNDLGCKAAHLVSYTKERQMDDPIFFPFYEAAQELDIPLFCHPEHPRRRRDIDQPSDAFFPDAYSRPAAQLRGAAGRHGSRRGFRKISAFESRLLRSHGGILGFLDAPHGRRLRSHQGRRHVPAVEHAAVGICEAKLLHHLRVRRKVAAAGALRSR